MFLHMGQCSSNEILGFLQEFITADLGLISERRIYVLI